MSDSFDGEIGAGSAPERKHELELARLLRAAASGSPAPRVMLARPPPIFVRMTGARVDDVVEDDREAPLDVRAGDLFEAVGAGGAERHGDVVAAHALLWCPEHRRR